MKFGYLVLFWRFGTAGALTIAPVAAPLTAIASSFQPPPLMVTQVEPAPPVQQVFNACVHSQAETLPSPFTDVPHHHWAFKAVLTLHYCGANRQATPPRLMENRTKEPSPEQALPAVP